MQLIKEDNRRAWVMAATLMLGLALLKLWLVRGQDVRAIWPAPHDDGHFVATAQAFCDGHWQTDYDQFTLIKGPVFPLWLALNSKLGVPYIFGQHLLYAFACLVLVVALYPVLPRWSALLPLYLLVLFNPLSYSDFTLRVIRESIYPAQTLLIIACLVGLHTYRESRLTLLSLWAVGLGGVLAAFWLTREEGTWLVPTVAGLLAFTAGTLLYPRPQQWFVRLALLILPIALTGLAVQGVAWRNGLKYGVHASCEMRWDPLLAAYGSLTRVNPSTGLYRVPVTRATREQVYATSPAFRELQPFLEGTIGRAYLGHSLTDTPEQPHEMCGGFFLWALRDAVACAGHYRHGTTAAAFYRRLADEVNTACAAGALSAGPPRQTLLPPWRMEFVPLWCEAFSRGMFQVLRLENLSCQPRLSATDANGALRFRTITRERLAPTASAPAAWPSPSDQGRINMLQGIGICYQVGILPAAVLALLATTVALGMAWRQGKVDYLLIVAVAAFGAVVCRVLVLSYLETTSFRALKTAYLSCAYPPLLLFIALGLRPWVQGLRGLAKRMGNGDAPSKAERSWSPTVPTSRM